VPGDGTFDFRNRGSLVANGIAHYFKPSLALISASETLSSLGFARWWRKSGSKLVALIIGERRRKRLARNAVQKILSELESRCGVELDYFVVEA